MAKEEEDFEIISDLKKITNEALPKIENSYSIKNKKTFDRKVRVTAKRGSADSHTAYIIEIMVKDKSEINLEKRFSELKQLEADLITRYGSETDIGTCLEIEKLESSYAGYHVLPFLDPCESMQQQFSTAISMSNEALETQKIKKRIFKIEHFILKIINHSILEKSVPWKNFIDKSKSQNAVSTKNKFKGVAEKLKQQTVDYLMSFMKDTKEEDSLNLTYKNLVSLSEQMNAQKEILTVCQELVGSIEPTYKKCLEDLNTQVWHLEDLFEQVGSIIQVNQKMKELQEKIKKPSMDDIEITNMGIFLHNTERFFEQEKKLIEASIAEDLEFIIEEFRSIVNTMTNIKQT